MIKLTNMTFLANVARNLGAPILPDMLLSFATLNITTVQDLEKLVNVSFLISVVNQIVPVP
jgi:hypothetical protein